MRQSKAFHFIFTVIAAMTVAGCDVSTPSQVKTGDIRLVSNVKTEVLDAFDVDHGRVGAIAKDYRLNGEGGGLHLVMPYRTVGDSRTAAQERADHYKEIFRQQGVSDVEVNYVAVSSKKENTEAVVTYTALQALPPEHCRRLTGYQGADNLDDMRSYSIGCETKSVLSKMIVRSADLTGRGGMPEDGSKRQGILVEKYMSGQQNQKLQGMNASEVGSE